MGVGSAMYTGVSGLNSFSNALGVVSDNVANSNTTAFKSSSVRFGDMVSGYFSTQSDDTDREGAGSTIMGLASDFSQGPMQVTNKWSDLAINGEGYFQVQAFDSASGTINGPALYTRDGSFHLDMNGYIVNTQGRAVIADGGGALQIEPTPSDPTYMNYNVDASGVVWGTPTNPPVDPVTGLQDFSPVNLGTIQLTTFANPDGLIRQGGNLFIPGPQTGAPVSGAPNSGPRGTILDINIEGSNVDLAMEMVNMIIYQADYNANAKTISTSAQMLETLVNIVR